MKRKLLHLAAVGAWCCFLIELSLFILVQTGVIKTLSLPSYALQNVTSRFWVDINKDVGIWHGPHSSYVHRTRCFNVSYEANAFGARDRERKTDGPGNRVVVIGDSLMEGFGVDSADRVTDLLEASTGREHLNFGCAGFGTTQYALAYETMASTYSHDSVLVGLSPNTDFHDDDIEYGKVVFNNRYRPYYIGEYPKYSVHYYQPTMNPDTGTSPGGRFKGLLREFTYTYNVASHVRARIAQREVGAGSGTEYSGYYDFSAGEFMRARYSLERIAAKAARKGAKMYVFTMPKLSDFLRYKSSGPSPLQRQLAALSAEAGFEYVDLLPLLFDRETDWARYFYSCDGHYNKYGNLVVQQLLRERFSLYQGTASLERN